MGPALILGLLHSVTRPVIQAVVQMASDSMRLKGAQIRLMASNLAADLTDTV
jgi:hypothetical protein